LFDKGIPKMRTLLNTILPCIGVIAILSAGPVRGAGTPASPAPDPSGARLLTLKNGARLLLVPDPRASAIGVAVWIEAGVKYERPGILGISHLAEHLSARGIVPGGDDELRRRIEATGGTTASFTTADFTCFAHAIPREALELVLKLEAGRFAAHPTQAMLDLDRAATREEIRGRARANPLERPLERLYGAAFISHPYRWPVLGSDEDLARITLEDCEQYLRTRYAPDQALITLVGDFDPEDALGLIRRHIEPIGGRGGRRAPAGREAMRGGERRRTFAGDLPARVLAVGWRVPDGADATDAAALDLLSTLLSGGPSARLTGRLIARDQTCLFARTGRDRQRDATMFWAAAVVRSGLDSALVEESLVGEVEKLAGEPVGDEELDRARRQLEVAMLLGRQSARDHGQVLGTAQMVAGDWHDADRQLERLRALTPADVQQAAARTLAAARRTVVWSTATASGPERAGGRP
jgi:zinc protease